MKRFKEWKRPEIIHGVPTKYGWMVSYPENLKLGYGTDIGAFTYINAQYGVEIGDFVQIGAHCSIYSISTIDGKKGKVVLEQNCRIGANSVILPSVRVGKNSIVGAMSLVNKDIPSNVVAYGIPAKVVRNLTADEIREIES